MKRLLTGFLALILIIANPCFLKAADTAVLQYSPPCTTKEGMPGCNVFSIKVEGRQAKVSFESSVDAALVAAIYNEEGTQMLAFGRTDVSANQKEAIVEIDSGQNIPQYFYLRGMLLDKDTLRPLCAAYESPVYTKGITEIQPPALSGDVISYPLDSAGVTGNLELNVHPSVKIFESDNYQYAEIRLDYSARVTGLHISSAGEQVLSLPEMASFPSGTNLSFQLSADRPAQLDAALSGTIGYSVLNNKGIHNLSSVPSVQAAMPQEGNVSLGFAIDFANMNLGDTAGTALSMKAAVSGKAAGQQMHQEDSETVRHTCESCLQGNLFSKTDFDFRADRSSTGTSDVYQNTYEILTGAFYHSSDGNQSDTQPCPHQTYRIAFEVLNANGEKIRNAQIQAVSMETSETITLMTDEHGRASEYLPNGTYEISAGAPDGRWKSVKTTIASQAKRVTIRMGLSPIEGTPPNEIITSSAIKVKSMILGDTHSGMITQDGCIYTWGGNRYGQLGNGTTQLQASPQKIQLEHVKFADFGMETSGAVTEDGSLYTWGWNYYGQLGYEKTDEYNPLPKKVDLPGRVIALSMGGTHSSAITEDGSLYTWGNNSDYQLGTGAKNDEYHPTPEKVILPEPAIHVSCGNYHSGAVTKDGSLYTWGDNNGGQLGRDTSAASGKLPGIVEFPNGSRVLNMDFGYMHSGAVTEDGLYMWGSDFLGNGETLQAYYQPIKIDIPKSREILTHAIGMNSALLTEDGYLYTWGTNDAGELGDGTTDFRNVPAKIETLQNVVSASFGQDTAAAITQDGSVYVWGSNFFGHLGNGTTSDDFSPNSIPKILFPAGTDTAVFRNLSPNETYEFYIVKDKTKADPLAAGNLLYLAQGTADSSGLLKFSYLWRNDYNDIELFVKGADKKDISAAQITISNLEYNGEIQYVYPAVSYNGILLKEGKDYELAGSYCGKDAGTYTLFIQGIGDYKGIQRISYQILPGIKLVENITLSLADGSVEAGSTLQLIAEVYPKDAADTSLKWSTANPEIAVVDQNGLVTGIHEGHVRITASSQDGSNISADCIITVTVRPSDKPSGGNNSNTGSSSNGSGSSSGGSSQGNASDNISLNLSFCILHFITNGGDKLSRIEMTLPMNDKPGIMPDAKRKHYSFDGWYTQKESGRKIEEDTVLNASMTLYAHWDKVEKPAQIKKLSLKRQENGQVMVQFQALENVQGYEIVYSPNKNFASRASRKKLIASKADTAKILLNPKKNSSCYIRVRAYRTDSAGNKIYGIYSSAKQI